MNKLQADMNQIDDSLHELGKLVEMADVFRAGVESARRKYALAVSHRMEELEEIESELRTALSRDDMAVEEYRRFCRSLSERVARLRGVKRTV